MGEFTDPAFAAAVVEGASAVVTTVHPMGSDRATQQQIGVEGTSTIAGAAAAAGVDRLVHVSTAAVYDRSPGVGDVDEGSALVAGDAGDYPVTKRDTDVALAGIGGPTRVLLRPPAILGAGETSVWNTLRPASLRDDERARRANPARRFAWVHVDDLAAFAADLASGRIADLRRPRDRPGRGGVHPRQRRRRPGHPPRLLRHRHRRPSASTRSGTTVPPGPASSSPTAPAPGAGRRRSTSPRRSPRSTPACAADRPDYPRRHEQDLHHQLRVGLSRTT